MLCRCRYDFTSVSNIFQNDRDHSDFGVVFLNVPICIQTRHI